MFRWHCFQILCLLESQEDKMNNMVLHGQIIVFCCFVSRQTLDMNTLCVFRVLLTNQAHYIVGKLKIISCKHYAGVVFLLEYPILKN